MYNFGDIRSAQKKIGESQEKYQDKFEEAFKDGFRYFLLAREQNSPDLLKKSADKLLESLNYKSSRYEPYFLISQIFFIIGKNELALKYLKIAEKLNDTINEIKDFKVFVYKDIN